MPGVEAWREAVWRAVPEDARPERFAERRAFLLANVSAGERVLDLSILLKTVPAVISKRGAF